MGRRSTDRIEGKNKHFSSITIDRWVISLKLPTSTSCESRGWAAMGFQLK
jgi:hypothetical protein